LYRRTFSGVDGQLVLADILIDLCWFDEIEDDDKVSFEEKAHLRNAGQKILRKCGILTSKNVQQLVKAMFSVPRRE